MMASEETNSELRRFVDICPGISNVSSPPHVDCETAGSNLVRAVDCPRVPAANSINSEAYEAVASEASRWHRSYPWKRKWAINSALVLCKI